MEELVDQVAQEELKNEKKTKKPRKPKIVEKESLKEVSGEKVKKPR